MSLSVSLIRVSFWVFWLSSKKPSVRATITFPSFLRAKQPIGLPKSKILFIPFCGLKLQNKPSVISTQYSF